MLFHETVYNTRWLKELKGTLPSLKLINSLSRHSITPGPRGSC
uniref:Uncharacterized protein n=1 Tax=Anguilla anguilla TaxID=7936 RepID=A0A0E9PUW2_ANGAN